MAFYDELINQWVAEHPGETLPAEVGPTPLSADEQASVEFDDPALAPSPLPQPAASPPAGANTSYGAEISTFNPESARQRLDFANQATAGMDEGDAARARASADAQLTANDRQAAQGVAAQSMVGAMQANYNAVTSSDMRKEAQMYRDQAIDEAAAEADHTAKINQALADWQAQSAKVSAMRVDPDRLMKNAGPTGRLGFGAAAFMEGFLGAKGIKIKAMDQINKRIDDDINAQLTDIEQGKETTAQFRMFYEAARQGASDDRLIRNKLQAFYLAAHKSTALANAANAQSGVDAANNMKLVADITRAQIVNEANIQKGMADSIQNQVNETRKLKVQWAGIANDKAKWQAEDKRIRDLAGNKPVEQQPIFVDPQTGQKIGTIRPGFETMAPKIQEDAAVVSAAVARLRSIRDKFEASDGRMYNGPLAGWLSSGNNRELFAEYQRAYLDLRRAATGTASSAKEDEAIKSGSPFPEFTGVSPQTAAKIMNDRIGEELDKADTRLRSFSAGDYTAISPAWRLEADQYNKQSYESSSESLQKNVRSPGANDPSPDKPGEDWAGFIKTDPDHVPQLGLKPYDNKTQPAWASNLETQLEAAKAGSQEAQQGLWLNATDPEVHPNRRAYAQYLLSQHPELAPTTSNPDPNAPLFAP